MGRITFQPGLEQFQRWSLHNFLLFSSTRPTVAFKLLVAVACPVVALVGLENIADLLRNEWDVIMEAHPWRVSCMMAWECGVRMLRVDLSGKSLP